MPFDDWIANQLDVICQTSRTPQASQATTAPENKRCESYPRLLYESLEIRGKANDISRKQKTVSTVRETNAIESKGKCVTTTQHKKTHQKPVKRTTDKWTNHFTLPGFKIYPYPPLPTPVTTENNIRRELLKDFDLFARRMRLQYIYYDKEREPHPFHVKSDLNPPIQPSFRGFRNLSRGSEIRARRESI